MSHCRIHSVSAAPTAVWCSAESEPDLNWYLPKHPSTTCWVRIQNVPSTLFPEEAAMTDVHAKAPRSLETGADSSAVLLRGLVAHLREHRTELRKEWARRIIAAKLLNTMTDEEIFAEVTSVYDNYVDALETGTFEALQAYARNLSERIIPRGVQTDEVVGVVLLLRDVLARSFFARYRSDFNLLNRILDAYEPAANRIANTVAVGFVQERERIIREQQETIRGARVWRELNETLESELKKIAHALHDEAGQLLASV